MLPVQKWIKAKLHRLASIAAVLALLTSGVVAMQVAASAPAWAASCGDTLLAAGSWLQGVGTGGVDVHSNAQNGKSWGYDDCAVPAEVYDLNASPPQYGDGWQCVELVNRLYKTQGWITKYWSGNGSSLVKNLPTGLTPQYQNSITSIVPGDVVTLNYGTYGHAGVVSKVTPVSGSSNYTVQIVNQNTTNVYGSATWDPVAKTLSSEFSGFTTQAVIHAAANTATVGGSDHGYEVALQGTGTQHLWMFGTDGEFDGTLGVQDGTNPSIAALSGGGYEVAMQGAGTQHLWMSGTSGEFDTQLGVQSGTSPSIAGLSGGGYEVAFVASGTQHLYMFGSAGEFDTQLTVQSGSSPSITGLPNNGYEVAFVGAGSGHLWMFGTVGEFDTQMGVQPNTSPSVAGLVGGGYQVAIQGAGNQDLWVFGSSGQFNTQEAIQLGTSPSITGLPNGGYEIAFQGAGNQQLWLYGSAGSFDTGLGVQDGTSPSIGTLSSSTSTTSNYEVAFVASGTQDLYLFGNDGEFDGQLGIQNGTSPSIAGLIK